MKGESFIEGCVVVVAATLLAVCMAVVFATGAVLSVLRLMVTPGGAAIVIALIGLYVWLNGGFA